MEEILPGLTVIGLASLASSVFAAAAVLAKPPNYPRDPTVQLHRWGALFAGRAAIAAILYVLSSSPLATGSLAAGVASAPRYYAQLLGPLYFPASVVIDSILYAVLHRREWCRLDAFPAANLPAIPFISSIPVLAAVLSRGGGFAKPPPQGGVP